MRQENEALDLNNHTAALEEGYYLMRNEQGALTPAPDVPNHLGNSRQKSGSNNPILLKSVVIHGV